MNLWNEVEFMSEMTFKPPAIHSIPSFLFENEKRSEIEWDERKSGPKGMNEWN